VKKRLSKTDAVSGLVRNDQYLQDFDEFFGGDKKLKRFSPRAGSFCFAETLVITIPHA